MDLYEKRNRPGTFAKEYLPQLEAGGITTFVAAIYIEDRYLPAHAQEVALGQMECMRNEAEDSGRAVICRTYSQIDEARKAGKIAIIFGMEGAEPIGQDLALLSAFYGSGLRMLGLTHARPNAAAYGGKFAPSGSSRLGLTNFGIELVQECESLGIILDLAHINPAGFDQILLLTKQPPVVSHTNARRFYDIERNISDAQIRAVGERGGVIGLNSVLVSSQKNGSTLDRYVDHIEHIAGLIGIDSV